MVPQFKTRHTVNANMQEIGSEQELIALMQSWQPSALFCMNALDNGANGSNVVVRLHNVLAGWGGVIVYRQYDDHEAELWNYYGADSYVQGLAAKNAPWALYNVGNEPHPGTQADRKKMARWYAQVVEAAVKWGVSVILPGGFASGSFSNDELRDLDEMWVAMAKYRDRKRADGYSQIALGSHEYAHVDPRFFVDGEDPRILMNPAAARSHKFRTEAEIYDGSPQDNYLMLRTENIYDAIAAAAKISSAEARTIDGWITESDLDRMPNVETGMTDLTQYLDNLNGGKTYGLPTCLNVLSKIYGKDGEEVYADILQWEEEHGYRSYYKALCHFTWSENNKHPFFWRDRYGWRNQKAVHHAWAIRLPTLKPLWKGTTVIQIPVPKPANAGAGTAATLSEDYKLRSGPGKEYDPEVIVLKKGVAVTYYPSTLRPDKAGQFQWMVVEGSGKTGWMANQGQFLAPLPAYGDAKVLLDVPYVDQNNKDTAPDKNDCGQACVVGVDAYVGYHTNQPDLTKITVNQANDYLGNTQLGTSRDQLVSVLWKTGKITAYGKAGVTLDFIRQQLDAGLPFIALVQRGELGNPLLAAVQPVYKLAHWITVIGYGEGFFVINDPYAGQDVGYRAVVAATAFTKAFSSSTFTGGTNAANQGVYLHADTLKVITPTPEPEPVDVPRLWTAAELDSRIEARIEAQFGAGK